MSPRVTPRRRGAYSTPAIAASRPIPPTSYELALERAEREQRDRSTWQQYVATMPARDEQRSARDIAASHAVTTADTRASWRWATARTGVDPRGTLNKEENRALSKASGGAGGFVVPTDFDQAIIAAARPTRVLGALAREITTTHGRTITVPSATTHGTGAWVAENANEAAASDETFAQTTLGAFKARTKVIASEELAHDVPGSFDEVIAAELGPRLAAVEEPAFIAGDGSGKPLGIVHTSSPYTTVTAATGNVTNLNWAAYIAAAKALPASYRQNATWALSVDAFSNLAGLLDTAGSPIRNADSGRLLGFPYVVSSDMPGAGASNRTAALGDWQRAYTVRRVTGLRMLRLDELHSDTGQIGYRLISRVDGRPVLTEAAVVLRDSAT